jgi:endo-1,4-beta-D-glucanase Y
MPFSQLIFQSGLETIPVGGSNPEFNQSLNGVGETVTLANNGFVGKSLRVQVQDADSQCGVTKSLTAGSKAFEFWFRLDSSANNLALNQGKLIFKAWTNTNFTGDMLGVMIRRISATNIEFGLTSNTSTFANSTFTTTSYDISNQSGSSTAQKTWFRLAVSFSTAGIDLFVDGAIVPTLTIPATGYTAATVMNSFIMGKFFQGNVGWGNNTVMYYDNLKVYDANFVQTTDADKAKAAGLGFLRRYVSTEGCVVRYPNSEAAQATFFGGPRKIDCVSEGQAYGLMLAVQLNEKTIFDSIETYSYSISDRRNRPTPGSPNFMAWIHDPTKADSTNNIEKFPDEAFAIDADADRCMALLWANARWGSNGTINYLSRALAISRDIVDICGFVGTNNLRYLISGGNAGPLAPDPNGINPSYFQNYLFYKLKQVDTPYSNQYQQLIDGSNDFLAKSTDNLSGLPTTAGLFPNFAGLDTATNQPINPPASWMNTDYTYDAIRTAIRCYMSFLWHNDTPNQTLLSGSIYTFMAGQWLNGTGQIKAEYSHTGSVIGNYENTMMYALNSWIFKTQGDNTNYNLIRDTKVKNTFQASGAGDAYGYYTGLTTNGYFGSFWTAWSMLLDQGLITDLGATIQPPIQPDVRYYLNRVYPELNTGKIRTYLN